MLTIPSDTRGDPCLRDALLAAAILLAGSVACPQWARTSRTKSLDASSPDCSPSTASPAGSRSSSKSGSGRRLDPELADLGRNLFFDPIMALRRDNSCAGCHAPQFGFADSQSIAIGIRNNNIVGHFRTRAAQPAPLADAAQLGVLSGPDVERAVLRRRPTTRSTTRSGFVFPLPEGTTRVPAGDPRFRAPAGRPGAPAADRAGGNDRLRRRDRAPRTSTRASTSSTTAWGLPSPGPTRAAFATSRSATACCVRAQRQRQLRAAVRPRVSRGRAAASRSTSRWSERRSPSSSSRSPLPTRRSTSSPAATGGP